jgi:HPt (histidine-containing phosphotransfer) domain-containing protein
LSYCGGDEEFYMEMLSTYYKQGNEYTEKLPVYYEQKDWKNYSIIAHAMKSTSLSIGARKFSEMAKEHEMAGKNQNGIWIEENWNEFFESFIVVLNAVEKLLPLKDENEKEPVVTELISQDDYKNECELLLDYLRNYEMNAAMEQIEKLEGVATAEMNLSEKNEIFEKITIAIDEFDYGTAEELLEEWVKGV